MKFWSLAGWVVLASMVPLGAQVVIKPQVVPGSPAPSTVDPHRWTGIVTLVPGGKGSGVVVAPRVYATAAHVVYDDDGWLPADEVLIKVANHVTSTSGSTPGVALHLWTSYATRVQNDGTSPGSSSIDTFNIDFAAVVVGKNLVSDGSYARTFVDEPNAVSILRQPRAKTIIGYPQDSIPLGNKNKMHDTLALDYETYWWAIQFDESSHVDSENLWFASYYFVDVETFGGNSGGPVFVRGNDERFYLNALLVGGTEGRSTVRGIDAAAWAWIEAAAEQSGVNPLKRVIDLGATATPDFVEVTWTDRSGGETGYIVERRDEAVFAPVATLPADSSGYLDTNVVPGSVYQYRVYPIDGAGNMAPPSGPARVETPGANRALAEVLGEPLLYFRSSGEVPMYATPAGEVESGKIWAMERSALALSLIGPGQLTFSWSSSSEINPDFSNPQSPYEGDIYDALYLYENGNQIDFLSGFKDPRVTTINVPEGPHTYEWSYEKDPYTDEGDDLGRIQSVSWTPQNLNAFIYGARQRDANWREATWFGAYTSADLPWAYHEELGWLYLSRISATEAWGYSPKLELGWVYISPNHFPFVYAAGANRWYYLLRGSGSAATGVWFYDLSETRWVRL